MKLIFLRHAEAEQRDPRAATEEDAQRALTPRGRRRMERVARGLRRLEPDLTCVLTSPLVRARQTAQIVADAYGGLAVEECAELAPGRSPAALASWLAGRDGARLCAVGHEPDLSFAATWLLSGLSTPFLRFKKSGACALSFPGDVGAGRAELCWALDPRALRRLS